MQFTRRRQSLSTVDNNRRQACRRLLLVRFLTLLTFWSIYLESLAHNFESNYQTPLSSGTPIDNIPTYINESN